MIRFENVSIDLGGHSFFKDISFEIKEGELVHIVGENGSGKSTLIESIIDLLPISSGQKRNGFGSDYGYLPQVAHQFPKMHLHLKEICKKEFSFYPANLHKNSWHLSSGGERKKALIAKAFSESNRLLLLDEPFNHLDKESVEKIINEMNKFVSTGGTIIFTGHGSSFSNAKMIEVSQWRF